MMRVVMTGANCLLGWTTLVRMRALTDHEVMPVDVANWDSLGELVGAADPVIPCVGFNRASDRQLEDGNAEPARGLARAAKRAPGKQASCGPARSRRARECRPARARSRPPRSFLVRSAKGSPFSGVVSPNSFGEHGRRVKEWK